MIEINLLPKELRKKEKLKLPKEFYIAFIGVLGFFIVLHALTGVMVKWKQHRVTKLDQAWNKLIPVKKEADSLKAEISGLSQRVGGIDQLIGRRFLWSKKLNQLSDLIVPGIWLRELSLMQNPNTNQAPTLSLKGSVISRHKEEMAVVGKFMNNLKSNVEWAAEFNNIELESIKRVEIKDTEIMDFILTCYFKEGIL